MCEKNISFTNFKLKLALRQKCLVSIDLILGIKYYLLENLFLPNFYSPWRPCLTNFSSLSRPNFDK